ncbi:hypothetical protein LJC20_00245 [Eubacteriales bacterium OttesenSCG-928-M02]|nr:hypothetical protein [Eubacteriales bacterium OttesenSCG-928-M02]
MVCGCEQCSTLMVQDVKGEDSSCTCPACGFQCNICLGFRRPLSKEELQHMLERDFPSILPKDG